MAAAGVGTLAPGEEAGTEPEAMEAVALAIELGGDVNAVDPTARPPCTERPTRAYPGSCSSSPRGARRIEVWNRKNKYGWTPLSIAEGHRPGNFKPSPETIAAIQKVMLAAGISPAPETTPSDTHKAYGSKAPEKPVP